MPLLEFWAGLAALLHDDSATLTRQEPVPACVRQFWVFGQLSAYHELLDPVDWVDVVHTVHNDTPDLLQAFVGAHCGDCIALYEHIAVGQKLNCLGCMSASMSQNSPDIRPGGTWGQFS